MNKTAVRALIIPDANGWRLSRLDVPAQTYPDLAALAATLPLGTEIEFTIPCAATLLERLRLPSSDRSELAGMVQLQLEKTLPYPVDEVSSDFLILATSGQESTVLSVAAAHAMLEELWQPFRQRGCIPLKVTPLVAQLAAACPPGATVLLIYPEQGQMVVAIAHGSQLSWAQVTSSTDVISVIEELPQLMLSAEIEGAPTGFSRVRLTESCSDLTEALDVFTTAPAEIIQLEKGLGESTLNLLPSTWRAEIQRGEHQEALKKKLFVSAAVYLALIALALGYLAWLKNRVRVIDAKYAALAPEVEKIQAQQTRWKDLALALDMSRFGVEVLNQATQDLPSAEVGITEFEHNMAQWRINGEAPSYSLAVEYITRLKAEKALAGFDISAGPPKLENGERAQFTILGK